MQPDGFERRLSGNLGHTLAQILIRELNLNARSERPGLLGRSSMAFISEVDRQEAYRCGQAAVRVALDGCTDAMVSLERKPGPVYSATVGVRPLEEIAGQERLFPLEWISPQGNDVLPDFLNYARPLLGPMQYHARL